MNLWKDKKINKTQLAIYVLTVWLLISLGYLGWNLFGRIRHNFLEQGYVLAVRDMVVQSQHQECQPFFVFSGEQRVELINVSCLTESTDSEIIE